MIFQAINLSKRLRALQITSPFLQNKVKKQLAYGHYWLLSQEIQLVNYS